MMRDTDRIIPTRRRGTLHAGAIFFIIGLLLILAPLLLGRGMLNKYIVTAGFLGACLGLALLLNGVLDHWLGRR